MSGWEENSCERPTKVEENGRLVGKIKQDKEQERGIDRWEHTLIKR